MISKGQPRTSVRSRVTDSGWTRKSYLLGSLISGIGLASAVAFAPQALSQVTEPVAPQTTGQVVTYETEFTKMKAFADPRACNNAPQLAHTIMNFTNEPITLYADDRCATPLVDVEPGFASHVAPGQSFSTE